MKVRQFMERINMTETGRAIAYIKDGLDEMNMLAETHVKTVRMDIEENKRFYDFPHSIVKVVDIRAKNHSNSKDEYRSIPRTIRPPATEDSDGV